MTDVPVTRTVIVWVTEGTWRGCVDAARALAPAGAAIALLHASPDEVPGAAHGAYAGLLGRGHPERDPGPRLAELATASAGELLEAAAQRLGRPCTRIERRGRVERNFRAALDSSPDFIAWPERSQSRQPPSRTATRVWPSQRSIHQSRAALDPVLSS